MSLQNGSMGKSTFWALYVKKTDTVAASVITATVFRVKQEAATEVAEAQCSGRKN